MLRKARRSIFGKLVIFAFWGFNILMVLWIWAGAQGAVESQAGMSGAEAAGSAIGTGIGTGIGVTLLIFVWLIGAIILGIMALLTRPK